MTAGADADERPITVALPERIDSSTVTAIEQQIMDMLRPGLRLIVDGGRVGYMSAAGVRMLATLLHGAQARRAKLAFCRFNGAAAECLLVSGFSRLLEVAGSVEEAGRQLTTAGSGIRVEDLRQRHTTG